MCSFDDIVHARVAYVGSNRQGSVTGGSRAHVRLRIVNDLSVSSSAHVLVTVGRYAIHSILQQVCLGV